MERSFLEQYRVHDKPAATGAAKRKEILTSETGVVTDRSKRIEAYLERLEEIFMHPDAKVRARRTDIFKEKFLYPAVIVQEANFPESYFEFQKQEAKRRGMGEVTFSAEEKQQAIAAVQEAQRKSLDAWLDHLTSEESHYPADIKYFVAQGILKTGKFDETNYRFSDREKSTTAPFRQIDHEALSMVMGALEAVHHKGDTSPYHPALLDLIRRHKDFGSMYAEAMRHLDTEAGKDKALEITKGEWRVFKQGSDPHELVNAFADKRAYLCLGNIGDATGYLARGDVHVYFSNNRANQPIWPRAAIAVKPKTGVYELRGTYNANEDIDPEMAKTDIIKDRLATIPNGESFAKRDSDMRKVTTLWEKCFRVDKKTKEKYSLHTTLTQEELKFLYELNAPIEGFGYQRDPRIAELRQGRNAEEDMLVTFDCAKDQIAHVPSQINENTKAYVGQLEPGIFQRMPENLEHVYTSFPDKKVRRENVEIGGKSARQLISEMEAAGINISDYAKSMLKNREFVPGKNPEEATLIRLTVADLGFKSRTTTDRIYERAQILGLELCPPDTGPNYRLQYKNQPLGEWIFVGMKQITDSDGNPDVFYLERYAGGLWLDFYWGGPDYAWHPDYQLVFRLRKPKI